MHIFAFIAFFSNHTIQHKRMESRFEFFNIA